MHKSKSLFFFTLFFCAVIIFISGMTFENYQATKEHNSKQVIIGIAENISESKDLDCNSCIEGVIPACNKKELIIALESIISTHHCDGTLFFNSMDSYTGSSRLWCNSKICTSDGYCKEDMIEIMKIGPED